MNHFEDKIRSWVKLDDELREVQKQVRDLRERRNTIANSIHTYIDSNTQLKNASINISDGRLKIGQTHTPQTLTFKFLEECLNEIIPNKDSVTQIVNHVKSKRSIKTTPDIKRFYSEN
jgi:seryl-tRNA synthetase